MWIGLVLHSLVPGRHARTVLAHVKAHNLHLGVGNHGVDVSDAGVISGQEVTVGQEVFLDKIKGLIEVLCHRFHFFFVEWLLVVMVLYDLKIK